MLRCNRREALEDLLERIALREAREHAAERNAGFAEDGLTRAIWSHSNRSVGGAAMQCVRRSASNGSTETSPLGRTATSRFRLAGLAYFVPRQGPREGASWRLAWSMLVSQFNQEFRHGKQLR